MIFLESQIDQQVSLFEGLINPLACRVADVCSHMTILQAIGSSPKHASPFLITLNYCRIATITTTIITLEA